METLFWMDEEVLGIFRLPPRGWSGGRARHFPSPAGGNFVIPASFFPPTILWTENGMLDNLFKEWAEQQTTYYSGNIIHEQYFEWKLRWLMDSQVGRAMELKKL